VKCVIAQRQLRYRPDDRRIPGAAAGRTSYGRVISCRAGVSCSGDRSGPAVLVLDDFAMRELTAAQADDLYELITERAGRSLILTSNRAPADWYPCSPTPSSPNHSSTGSSTPATRSLMNGPSYRPNKRPGRVIPTGNTSSN
jgi:hypothetical protein